MVASSIPTSKPPDPLMQVADVITVEVQNRQQSYEVDGERLRHAAETVLAGESVQSAELSVAVVDDATSHSLNRQFLQHDYPTDVLSFPLDNSGGHLEGEIVVSADTAQRASRDYAWSAADELLLYVVHGVLHLTGYDDHTAADRSRMREREQFYLRELGLEPRY